ncbi:MAG: substrate-binding domain-containing protein, partial [Lachnospiraceae bacterium]|nr:substrate-binding domain-containing protein [Lachnospiraceae bacterium]
TIRCTSPKAETDLIMGRLDLAVLLTHTLDHQVLEYIPLSQGVQVLAVPAPIAAQYQQALDQRDFSALKDEYFMLTPAPSFSRTLEDSALDTMGIRPPVLCEIEDNLSRRQLLNKNVGIGFLPDYAVTKEDTFSVYTLGEAQSYYVVAAYRKSVVLSSSMKDMIKLLLETFEKVSRSKV